MKLYSSQKQPVSEYELLGLVEPYVRKGRNITHDNCFTFLNLDTSPKPDLTLKLMKELQGKEERNSKSIQYVDEAPQN